MILAKKWSLKKRKNLVCIALHLIIISAYYFNDDRKMNRKLFTSKMNSPIGDSFSFKELQLIGKIDRNVFFSFTYLFRKNVYM